TPIYSETNGNGRNDGRAKLLILRAGDGIEPATSSLGIRRSIVNKEHMHPKRKFCPYTSTAFQQLTGGLRLNAVIAVTEIIDLAILPKMPDDITSRSKSLSESRCE